MANDRSGTFRILVVILGIVAVALVALFALRRAFSASSQQPTPTMAIAVAAEDLIETDEAAPEPALTSTPSPNSSSTVPSSKTPESEKSPTNSPSKTPKPSSTPTFTPRPSNTPSPSAAPSTTPTSLPQLIPLHPTFTSNGENNGSIATAVPTAVPTFQVPLGTTNVVLIGTDAGGSNMDTIIVVGINRDTKTASMLSIPRDTYVYITPSNRMGRINTARNPEQLKQTILYNFGIPIHYYAKVDFSGFKQAVNLLGGLEVAVSCQLRDWRLISPDLDQEIEENWEMFTLEPGVYEMDGDFALWYARSRKTTSDFDRGLRQQQLLRSMLNQGVDLNLLASAPELFNAYQDFVETDIDIGRFLQFLSLAPEIRENGVQHLYIARFLKSWQIPVSEGVSPSVQLPVFDEMKETLQHLFLPPALNRAARPAITVEIVNGTDNPNLARLAAENLAWYGFAPTISSENHEPESETKVQYFGPNLKGALSWLVGWLFGKSSSSFEVIADQEHPYEYRVTIGADFDPCLKPLFYDTFLR